MRVLLVKTSSMGDVLHTLPALTDAAKAIGDIQFDWVVEEGFQLIPSWHQHVANVVPIALRRWRKQPLSAITSGELLSFVKRLRQTSYDLIIDAQGLYKSAAISLLAKGPRFGADKTCSREPFASYAYQRHGQFDVSWHAIRRIRQLFSQSLDYPCPDSVPEYGINRAKLASYAMPSTAVVLVHGTTWATKCWPESYWQQLAQVITEKGYHVLLPWGNIAEQQRAQRIANQPDINADKITVLPKLSLAEVGSVLAQAKAVVAVDTGLGHMAAALDVPTISIYGPTDPNRIGTQGAHQYHLQSGDACASDCDSKQCVQLSAVMPSCFSKITPERVWSKLGDLL